MKSAFMRTAATLCLCLVFNGPIWAGDIKGKVTAAGMKSAGDIAVYVDAIPGKKFEPPAQHVVIDQKKMAFAPHVAAVLKGTTVDFLNSDPQGQEKAFQFNDLGSASLLCNVHPEMSGYVVVVPTPYFAVTNKDGSFVIKDVSPGHYTLKTWSEEGRVSSQDVDVTASGASVELTVKK